MKKQNVCHGGVSLKEVDEKSTNLRNIQGVYVCGEALQELFLTVEYESYRSTAWIEVIRESAVLTLLALDVVDFEMIRAANRAKLKLI